MHNPAKRGTFSIDERIELARAALAEAGLDSSRIRIGRVEAGLLVDHCRSIGATAIVKGFRTAADIEYELPMAQVNRDLSGIETLFIPAEAGLGFVSSSLVKQVAELGGDVSKYVTTEVAAALRRKFGK